MPLLLWAASSAKASSPMALSSPRAPLHKIQQPVKLLMGTLKSTHTDALRTWAILEAVGSSLNDVIQVTIYMASSEKFARMNEVYKIYWGDIKPARTTVFMSELPPKTLLEMKCVGLVTGQEVAKSKV